MRLQDENGKPLLTERTGKMLELRKKGLSFQKIGQMFGVTRQCVHLILLKLNLETKGEIPLPHINATELIFKICKKFKGDFTIRDIKLLLEQSTCQEVKEIKMNNLYQIVYRLAKQDKIQKDYNNLNKKT